MNKVKMQWHPRFVAAVNRELADAEMPDYQQLLKELGIEGGWEGIGDCAVGYMDGDLPKAAKRKENRVYWAE